MPKIVELVGPSGIGKSYITDKIRSEWRVKEPWAIYQDFRFKRKRIKDYSLPEYTYAQYFKLVRKIEYISHLEEKDGRLLNKKIFFKNHPKFVKSSLDLISDCCRNGFGGKDNRYMTTIYFLKSLEEIQAIMNMKFDNRVCLFEEGLINRIMHLTSLNLTEAHIEKYLQYMPLPRAVILLKRDIESILNNIKKRKRTATVHKNLSMSQIVEYTKKTQTSMDYSIQCIKDKGVNVHVINLDEHPHPPSDDIIKLLREF